MPLHMQIRTTAYVPRDYYLDGNEEELLVETQVPTNATCLKSRISVLDMLNRLLEIHWIFSSVQETTGKQPDCQASPSYCVLHLLM